MRFTLRIACLAMATMGLCLSQASAQFCGVSVDCGWATPNVGHWTFDDLVEGGNADDSSGNGNTANWQGSEPNVPAAGIIGGASAANDQNGGSNEHYRMTLPQLNGANGITMSIWFNQNLGSNGNNVQNGLIGSRGVTADFAANPGPGRPWQINLERTTNGVDARINNGGTRVGDGGDLPPGSTLPTDEEGKWVGSPVGDAWHHVAITWDGTTGDKKTYFDGQLLGEQLATADVGSIVSSTNWFLGEDDCCGNREFTGTLDDAGIWDSALSATDIGQIYTAGLSGVNLSKVEPPQPGDTNLDGNVDLGIDFAAIQENFFTESGADRADGDLTGGGAVEWADFREWKDNFPTTASVAASNAVPEPSTGLIITLACFGLGFLRRKS